jgi:transcriptional regulator
MSAPFTREFLDEMRVHVWNLREKSLTWQEISDMVGIARSTCQAMGERPRLFRKVTRVMPNGVWFVVQEP